MFDAESFDRLEDGTYVRAGHGGSPVFLRVTAHEADGVFVTRSDGGEATQARLVPLPSARCHPSE